MQLFHGKKGILTHISALSTREKASSYQSINIPITVKFNIIGKIYLDFSS